MCVSRIFEQWDALELFFANAALRDRLVAAENVAKALKSPIFKMYFQFLDYVLPKFTKLFQSEKPNLHCLAQELASLYKSLLSCYMTSTYIRSQPLASLDLSSRNDMLPLTSMYMGHSVANSLAKPEVLAMSGGFLEHCQIFYVEAALQIKQRFPLNDPVISGS